MNELKTSITFLVSYVIIVLGTANIDEFQESILDFSPEFFIIVAVVIVSGLMIVGGMIQAGVRLSSYTFIAFWFVFYLAFWFFYFKNSRPIEVQLVQLLLVLVSAGLSYDVGRRINQLDRTLEDLSHDAYPNRTREIRDAVELIDAEITRSRRYHHPLTVMVIRVNWRGTMDASGRKNSLQRDIFERFAAAKMSQLLSEYVRNTDLVLRDKNGQFIVVCPETNSAHTDVLAQRIVSVAQERLDVELECGSASFPDEALTFDDLLEVARRRLKRSGTETALASA